MPHPSFQFTPKAHTWVGSMVSCCGAASDSPPPGIKALLQEGRLGKEQLHLSGHREPSLQIDVSICLVRSQENREETKSSRQEAHGEGSALQNGGSGEYPQEA